MGASKEALQRDVVSLSGDSLALDRVIELTTDAILERDLRGNKERARELLEEALSINPENTTTNYQMALTLANSSSSKEELMSYAKAALKGDSTNKWIVDAYAQSLIENNRLKEAIGAYHKLIKLDPNEPNNYRILAYLYKYTDQTYKAIEVLDSAELKIGINPYLSSMKRGFLLSTNQDQKAIEQLKEEIANSPQDIDLRRSLANIYIKTRQNSLAEMEYKAALKIDSSLLSTNTEILSFYKEIGRKDEYFTIAHNILKRCNLSSEDGVKFVYSLLQDRNNLEKNYDEMLDVVSALEQIYPESLNVVKVRADILIYIDRIDEALNIYKTHARKSPSDVEFYKSILRLETYSNRLDSVNLYAKEATKRFAEDQDLHMKIGSARQQLDDFKGAIKSYNKALQLETNDTIKSIIWGSIGDSEYYYSLIQESPRQASKSRLRCYEAYDMALKHNKDNSYILNNYAYFLCEDEDGDLSRAREMSKRSLELDDKSANNLDTYGWILYKFGLYFEAEKHLRKAIALDPENAEIHLHYGDVLAKQRKYFMAEIYWDRAEKYGYDKEEIRRRKEEIKDKKSEQ